jgi:hypothetical protein
MTISDIQKKARGVLDDAKREGHSGASGPRTPEGKAISALNAVRHGLSAEHALLPGEDLSKYVRGAEETLVAFGATNEPLARLSVLIFDDLHKLERIERIERGLLLGRIEELLAQTEVGERAKKTGRALQVLGNACRLLVRVPVPEERGPEIEKRIAVMQAAINLISDALDETPMELVAACHGPLMALADRRAHPELPVARLAALVDGAQHLLDWLVERATRDEAAQEDLRKAIAGIALPAEAELKKLARYTRMIEESLTRRLAALEQLRKANETTSAATEEQARAFRLRLRVVT